MSAQFESIVCEPPFAEWQIARHPASDNSIQALQQSARRRFVDAAQQFVLRLNGIAESSELPAIRRPLLTGDPDQQPILMTGHQPSIFHSGLVYKYLLTEQAAAAQQVIGAAIVIDTDEGDLGSFVYPARTKAIPQEESAAVPWPLTTVSATLGSGPALFPNCRKRPDAELSEVRQKSCDSIQTLLGTEIARQVAAVLDDSIRMKTNSLLETNLILRWQHDIGSRLLELPLSAISLFPESLTIIGEVLSRAAEFAAAYNRLLDSFRAEQKIRNPANPFPNLQTAGDSVELPFWAIDVSRNRRAAVHVGLQSDESRLLVGGAVLRTWTGQCPAGLLEDLALAGTQIVPRNAMITGLLRLLFADVFVHGTGGARYDGFTERLLREWWNFSAGPFVVASASRFLFDDARAELARLEQVSDNLRHFTHHPQRYFSQNVFSSETEAQLKVLVETKEAAVADLKSARAEGRSGEAPARGIQEASSRIAAIVEAEFQPQCERLARISDAARQTLTSRMWPWMLFADPQRT